MGAGNQEASPADEPGSPKAKDKKSMHALLLGTDEITTTESESDNRNKKSKKLKIAKKE